MAIRTTPEAVGDIIELDDFFSVDPFIETANAIVDEHLLPLKKGDGSLWFDEVRLELIERWLSAHFYAIQDPRIVQESIGGTIQTQFQSKVDLGFSVTHYGQHAMLLDSSGTLAKLNRQMKEGKRPIKVSVKWMGKERE